MIYDTALLTSGFTLEQPNVFASRMYNIIELGLGIELQENDEEIDALNLETSDNSIDENQEINVSEESNNEESNNNEMEQVD